MKSSLAFKSACLALMLAGCGQTGPLYLPKPPAKASVPPPPPPHTPSPTSPAPQSTNQ